MTERWVEESSKLRDAFGCFSSEVNGLCYGEDRASANMVDWTVIQFGRSGCFAKQEVDAHRMLYSYWYLPKKKKLYSYWPDGLMPVQLVMSPSDVTCRGTEAVRGAAERGRLSS
ncbi:hypothetical protein Nepgr_012455 [Nepenthes gracilis]|uniref:Uncharacterized protein n=1 Tax=Nepenthes gracilis TaxID=150966 RepID=A0AAD3SH93_NEPGR|nr:hypothetical protein Nepgr_012455 [Nepenthes gracilis]